MVVRPTEISTDIHPYDVVPTRPLPVPATRPDGALISALIRAMHRIRVRFGSPSTRDLEPAALEPVGSGREASSRHAA